MINYSIIIPHYNIPDLLVRCLSSIPVREDVQVIVVDDCSPDYTIYKERYPELSRPYVELYQTPKGGSAGRARNIGLQHAKGRWLIFLDADDLLAEDACAILDSSINCTEDILFYNVKSVMSDDLRQISRRNLYVSYFEQYKNDKDEYLFRFRFHALWGKIFNKALIDKYKISFSETKYSNDVYFSIVAGYYARTIKVEERTLYIVTERQGSLASNQFLRKKPSWEECKIRLTEAIKVRDFVESRGADVFAIEFNCYFLDIRKYHTLHYLLHMAKLLVTRPSYVLPFYKLDVLFILKHLHLITLNKANDITQRILSTRFDQH